MAPAAIRMQLGFAGLEDYEQMRAAVLSYVTNAREWKPDQLQPPKQFARNAGSPQQNPDTMDVDAITQWRQG